MSRRQRYGRNLRARANHVRQRGAIYMEALLVIILLTIIFAAAMFVGSTYLVKLGTFARASALAFQNAGNACGPPLGGSYSVGTLISKPSPDPSNPDPAFLGGTSLAAAGQSSQTVSSSDVLGSKSVDVTTSFQLICNEQPTTKTDALNAMGATDWAVQGILGASGL